jgi:hypothetical protein
MEKMLDQLFVYLWAKNRAHPAPACIITPAFQ